MLLTRRLRYLTKPPTVWLGGQASRRNFAYPKEGVFQQQQQQPQHGSPNGLPPQQPQYGIEAPPQQSHFQYGTSLLPLPLPPQPPPPTPSRWRPRWTTVAIALISATLGFVQIRAAVQNFTFDVPSEEELAEDLKEAYRIFDELELVQSLRSAWHMVDGERKSVWHEHTAYQAMTDPQERAGRLTSGPLGNAHGVAAQRIFVSQDGVDGDVGKGAMVHFVCFGNGTTGFPRVVHGGAIATILDESFGRFTAKHVKERTAVTAYLETKYLDKVSPGLWYVIILGFDEAHKEDQTERKKYIGGVLACCEGTGPKYTGGSFENVHAHAIANALFVVPKDVSQLQPIPDEF